MTAAENPAWISSAEDFRNRFTVSRETIDKLEIYHSHLLRWQPAVNLVAKRTINDIWHRHFADSAQLLALLPQGATRLVDLGSGGGFPGLVLAILLADRQPKTVLIESDQRKAAFLRDVARVVEIDVVVLSTRIETDASVGHVGKADVVTARALAPLDRLFELAHPYCSSSTVCVFPKGRDVARELETARRIWHFAVELVPSLTDDDARIAVVRTLQRTDEG
ncbi:MAG: 16S rRNA (guanine(527)-N(7))-methyltransferase RsmG [Pseudomonadota bacterium]